MKVGYGVKIRKRERKILDKKNAKYECPQCGKKALKRNGYARWECRKCHAVIAGGAYEPFTTVGISARKALQGVKQNAA